MAKGVLSLAATACFWLFALALALGGAFVGWLSTTWLPEGFAFASLIPLVGGGLLPPALFGPFATPLTPPVPDDLTPQPRPTGEIFLKLAGTGDSMQFLRDREHAKLVKRAQEVRQSAADRCRRASRLSAEAARGR